MITDIDCGPNKVLVNGECVPATPEEKLFARTSKQADQSRIEYYKQYQADLPQYQTPGQGSFTGPGTGAFHPFYGRTGKSQSARVLATPYTEGGPGRIGGRSGYNLGDVMSGYRVGGEGPSGYANRGLTERYPRSTVGNTQLPSGEYYKPVGQPYAFGGPDEISPTIIDIGVNDGPPGGYPPLYAGPTLSVGDNRRMLPDGRILPDVGGLRQLPMWPSAGGGNGGLLNLGEMLGGGVPAAGGGGLSAAGAPSGRKAVSGGTVAGSKAKGAGSSKGRSKGSGAKGAKGAKGSGSKNTGGVATTY